MQEHDRQRRVEQLERSLRSRRRAGDDEAAALAAAWLREAREVAA